MYINIQFTNSISSIYLWMVVKVLPFRQSQVPSTGVEFWHERWQFQQVDAFNFQNCFDNCFHNTGCYNSLSRTVFCPPKKALLWRVKTISICCTDSSKKPFLLQWKPPTCFFQQVLRDPKKKKNIWVTNKTCLPFGGLFSKSCDCCDLSLLMIIQWMETCYILGKNTNHQLLENQIPLKATLEAQTFP